MFSRHAFLGLALAATGLVAGGATVWAGEQAPENPLHGPGARHGPHATPVVVDQRRTLKRVDRLIEGLRELDRLAARTDESITIEIRRLLREEQGGEQPRSRGETRGHDDERGLGDVAGRVREALGRRGHRGHDHDDDRDRDDVRGDLSRRIDRMRRDLVALHEEVVGAPPALVAEPVIVIEPVSQRVFAEYSASLGRLTFEDDRIERLEDYARSVYFTSSQVAAVLRRYITFDEYEAARVLYPRVVDPENVHRIYDAMRWRSDQERFRAFVRKHDG